MKARKSKAADCLLPLPNNFEGSDLPPEKFGTETEAEKQIKFYLDKQLNTKINLKDHFSQHRSFATPSTYTPLTQLIQGECSLQNFKNIETTEEKRQELQRSGLNQEEIELFTKNDAVASKKSLKTNPDILNEKLDQIKQKIINHNKELEKPETFKNIKILNRHEMEIEKTLYMGCNTKQNRVGLLVTEKIVQPLSENDPFKRIKELSETLTHPKHRKRKKNQTDMKTNINKESEDKLSYNPNIHHVIVPLEEQEVIRKRLHIEEIKTLPRFKEYESGNPNNVLFLKNLHSKANLCDLQTLFTGFEFENGMPIRYRILTGKMKGQAFVEFSNAKIAEKALNFANGYMLKERPLIIQYGRRKSHDPK